MNQGSKFQVSGVRCRDSGFGSARGLIYGLLWSIPVDVILGLIVWMVVHVAER